MASSNSQIDKPQRGHPKRAELLDVNNTSVQSINTKRTSLIQTQGFSDVDPLGNNKLVICLFNSLNSFTELEVTQASFRKKYDYGYFYFRDPSHIDDKLHDMDEDLRGTLLADYKSESEYAARKIKELKQQIIDTGLCIPGLSAE